MKAKTYTTQAAAKRHQGYSPRYFATLCLAGKRLLRRHGSFDNVPIDKRKAALFGQKIGKGWVIAASELDRYFCAQ